MGALLPVVLLILGVGAGLGAGFALRSPPQELGADAEGAEEHSGAKVDAKAPEAELSYVKINNQFVVPIIKQDRVSALVVLSLSLETLASETR
jgi:hypothetical protein